MSKNIIKLNSENIDDFKDQIINDVKFQYQDYRNVIKCNNIYYEELKENETEGNITLFFFLEGTDQDVKTKINKLCVLLNEKINKQDKQIKNFDIKDIKRYTWIYKKFTMILDLNELKLQIGKKVSANLFYVIFPLAVKTNDYYNFLINLDKEYKEKFKVELINFEQLNNETAYKNKIFNLPLPYFIYSPNKENNSIYKCSVYYRYSISTKSNLNDELIKNLRNNLDDSDETERENIIEKQNDTIKKINEVYENIFKDLLKYRIHKSCKYKDIKIIMNDYKNEEKEIEMDDEVKEETKEENKDKGENNIINAFKEMIEKDKFDKKCVSDNEYLNLKQGELRVLKFIKITLNDYKFETFEDLDIEIIKKEHEINDLLNFLD